mmetsp:Transcript_10377/g.15108  ORF Transcript_10377/g.15108 Transcript_10377/m.15108 type:complete len:128 (-) Transcript_10377:631-1014(-)
MPRPRTSSSNTLHLPRQLPTLLQQASAALRRRAPTFNARGKRLIPFLESLGNGGVEESSSDAVDDASGSGDDDGDDANGFDWMINEPPSSIYVGYCLAEPTRHQPDFGVPKFPSPRPESSTSLHEHI